MQSFVGAIGLVLVIVGFCEGATIGSQDGRLTQQPLLSAELSLVRSVTTDVTASSVSLDLCWMLDIYDDVLIDRKTLHMLFHYGPRSTEKFTVR